MWTKLDDGLFDHSKIILAGNLIGGSHGVAIALGTYTAGLLYANKHLTDGFLSNSVVKTFPHFRKPTNIVNALVTVGLWKPVDGGWQIHDFHVYQPTKDEVEELRCKRREAGRLGGQRSGVARRNHTPVLEPNAKQNASPEGSKNEAFASTMLNPVPSRPVLREETQPPSYGWYTHCSHQPKCRSAFLCAEQSKLDWAQRRRMAMATALESN